MKKKVLITGGDGDIACALSELFGKKYIVLRPNKKELDVTNEYIVKPYISLHKPDVIINCAGYIKPSSISESDVEEWVNEIEVNLIGSYIVSKYGILNDCECIINIGSSGGNVGKAEWSGYCASKRALVSLTESIMNEGTCCFCMSAGRTDTKMRKKLFPDETKDMLMSPQDFAKKVYDFYRYREIFGGREIVVKKNIDGNVECFITKISLERIV